MCQRPEFEEMEMDLDAALLALLRRWKNFRLAVIGPEDMDSGEWISEFMEHVRLRLVWLDQQDTEPELFGRVVDPRQRSGKRHGT
jgi:hypothetical protein